MAKTTKPKGTTPAAKAPSRKKSGSKAGDTLKAKQAAAGPARQPGVERRKNHPLRAKNGHIHVLLTQPVPHVGQPGELVNVRPGFARNYLLPQGLATFATPHNLLIVEKHRQRLKKQEEARRADLQSLALRSPSGPSPSRPTPTRRGTSTARSTPTRSPPRSNPRVSRSRPSRFVSRDRSRTWDSTPSRSTWPRTSTPRSSSGSSLPTPTKRHPRPDRPAATLTPEYSNQSGSWTRSFLLTSPSEQSEIIFRYSHLYDIQ